MAHDYAYTVDGTLLTTICQQARMLEATASGRVSVHEYAFQDGGDVQEDDWATSPKLTTLRTTLPYGTPAQIAEGLHTLSGLLLGGKKLLQRVDPHAGTVEADIAVIDATGQKEGSQRFEWDWPMWILPGHFRNVTPVTDSESGMTTSATIGSYTPGGTHPTAPVITLTCTADGDNPTVAMTTGDQESIAISGSFVATDVIVIDVPARTITLNGVRAKNLSNPSHGHWMKWAAGQTNTLTFTSDTGTWDADISYQERWRV